MTGPKAERSGEGPLPLWHRGSTTADRAHVAALTSGQLQARLFAHAVDPDNVTCPLCMMCRDELQQRNEPELPGPEPEPERAIADVVQVTPCRPIILVGVASPLDVLQAAEWDAKLERLFAPARPVIVPFVTSTQVIR